LREHRTQRYFLPFLAIGLLASIAPDLDLLYFYTIDHHRHLHHSYWTHIPMFWLLLYLFLLAPVWRLYRNHGLLLLNIIFLNITLHLLLDSFAGGIKWLYPVDPEYFRLFHITKRFNWWVANYLIHWTFLCELGITFSAALTVYKDPLLGGWLARFLPQRCAPVRTRPHN
jgi:inner membrane protein